MRSVVSVVHYLEPQHITLIDVLKVTVPSTILGIGLATMANCEAITAIDRGRWRLPWAPCS